MKSVYELILKRRGTVLLFFLFLLGAGVYSTLHLPVDATPDITNVQVMINTLTGPLEPDQIEKSVTRVIETEMSGLESLEEIRSISKFGLSQVNLIFKDGTDLYRTRNLVSQRLQKLPSLMPAGIIPEMAPPTTGLGEVFMYILRKKNQPSPTPDDLIYLRVVQDQTVRPQLKKVKGVAEIDTNGGFPKEIHINLDPQKMRRFGVRIEQLRDQISTIGENFGGGYFESQKEQIIVKTSTSITTLEQLKKVPIKLNYSGRLVRLEEIAQIEVGRPLRVGAATYDGNEVVLGTALMAVGSNSKQVATDLEHAASLLELPDDVELKIVYSRSYLVNATIKTVTKNLIEGAVLVVFILVLFLGRLSIAFMVALAIPFSMLMAALLMNPLHITANLMSLGAIDFGLLVDGSVVVVENILRRWRESTSSLHATIVSACVEVSKPVLIGIGIIVLVYVPILGLQGTEGKLFHPMAMTVISALSASLVVAVFLMPILSSYVLQKNQKSEQNTSDTYLYKKVLTFYSLGLQKSLQKTWFVPATMIFFFGLSVVIFMRLGSQFVPQLNEHDLVIGVIRDAKISLTESIAQQKEVEKIIRQFPQVELVFSRLGTPESATDPMGPNFADTFIILKKEQTDNASAEKTLTQILDALDKQFPDVDLSPTQPIEMRFNEMLEGSRADVSLRFYGPDLKQLLVYVEESMSLLKELPETSEVQVDALTALRLSPALNIELDPIKLTEYNISLPSAQLAINSFMAGERVGSFQDPLWRYPIVMRLDEHFRNDPEQIQNLLISTQDGGEVRLSQIAQIQNSERVTTIARSFGERYGAISLFLKGTDIGGFVKKAQALIAQKMTLKPHFRMEWGGQFKNLQRARLRLAIIIPLILMTILLLIYSHFQNFKLTLLVLSGIPFSVSGGLISLWLFGVDLSVSAIIGFIALMGISILNCMVLVEFMIEARHQFNSAIETVTHSCQTRLRPVLMTALVAAFGFIPMVLGSGMGSEVQRPLAIVVVGGIITATLSTLFVVPYLYLTWVAKD
jgi:heavy metal efflux system protein